VDTMLLKLEDPGSVGEALEPPGSCATTSPGSVREFFAEGSAPGPVQDTSFVAKC